MKITDNPLIMAVAALGVVALLYVWSKGLQETSAAVIGAAGEVAAGTVLGAGDVFGIPRTNATQCQIDRAAGNTWGASFACTAGEFTDYVIFNTK